MACFLASPALAQDVGIQATGSQLSQAEAATLLSMHNEARAKVGVKPLEWSSKIAERAQEWAETLVATRSFHHGESGYGENLAGAANVEQAVNMWLSEASDYNGRAIGRGAKGLHYTQAVWRKTRFVGCGKAEGPDYFVWVCNYDPAGNMSGEKPY